MPGQVTIDNPTQPMVGVIHGGCQFEADIFTPFYRDGYITLILDKNHADFQTANDIVQFIREKVAYSETNDSRRRSEEMVHAIDAANIRVRIPRAIMQRSGGVCLGIVGNPDGRAANRVAGGDQFASRHDRDQRRRGNWRRDRVAQERGGGCHDSADVFGD